MPGQCAAFLRVKCLLLAVMFAACSSGPKVSRTQALDASADAPYENILVIALFSSFDSRRYFEEEIVSQLAERGTAAVPSTSLMNTRTPVTRETFVKMVEDLDADAVLLTQLAALRSEGKFVDMNPEATVNLRPTGYWNVFSVDTTEYVEPRAVDFEHSLVLLTEVFSAKQRAPVWGIESSSKYSVAFDRARDYTIIFNEAKAIASHLARDGLIANR
ncbi:MAG: hypothetical protein R3192_14645 [Woeseiaceae bacterium]|nr:hypothetical protein [Woeseiaceae bacterium]